MRRSIIFGLCVIGLAAGGWWYWSTRRAPAEKETTSIMAIENFSSLSSPAFTNEGQIPKKYSCDGDNINPPLQFASLPPAVKYIAVIMDDPDAVGGVYDHWVVWDIPANSRAIAEASTVGVAGKNSARKIGYTGPCPPNGEHRYRFRFWGYRDPLDLKAGASKNDLLEKLEGRSIVTAELTGRYGGSR